MKYRIILTAMAALMSASAMCADGVNVSVTGNIVASPCLFNGGSSAVNVDLGDIQAANLATPGSTSAPVLFSLSFSQCPVGTRSVTVAFTGTPDPAAGNDYYANGGTARNVAIAMIDAASGERKGTGSAVSHSVSADRTVTMPMKAMVSSAAGGATAGSISAVVMLTLQYN
ncbi:fimbrial protein [Enterobacter sp. ECC-175]|uniref:fimbrial protein n=1 Tax=Enterobacter sp. ECC-175 TaxID=3116479 RepID=UPI003754CD0B